MTGRPESLRPGAGRFAAAHAVADAVLYEGYVLYPYRASARKNQIRWQFGVLVPPPYAAEHEGERCRVRTEAVVDAGACAQLHVRVRYLQVQRRVVEAAAAGGAFVPADSVDVDGTRWVAWDEAVEHAVDLPPIDLLPIPDDTRVCDVVLEAGETVELLTAADGEVRGRARRSTAEVAGRMRVAVAWADGPAALVKVTVDVENTGCALAADAGRDDAMMHSLLGVHTLLAVDDGQFVSLLDPPEFARQAVAGCGNDGTFPVLVGEPDQPATVMLSSPIILYDHPAVAPESPGDFCDATEIDEILALRVLTLTDEEKAEARGTDPRAAAIVDRCDDLPPEVWERLHGAVRSLAPAHGGVEPAAMEALPWWDPGVDAEVDPWTDTTWIGEVEVGKGTSVRLRPSRRADAHDLFLAGQAATVVGVFTDVDGDTHVAVTLDDDPATELLEWQGRYYYFHPDEIEVGP